MQGAALIGNQVVQVCQAGEKRRLTPTGVMEPFHGEELPVNGVMRLIQKRAAGWHLRVCEHGIPACLLVRKPAPYPLAIRCSSHGGDVIGKAAEPLAQRKHPQALPLARSVEQRMELGAQRLADWRRDGHEFLRKLVECVAQTVPQARPWKQRPQTFGGAVKAIGQHPLDAIRGLLLGCGALEHAIGLGQSRGTNLLSVAPMPHDASADYRGQIHLVGETAAVLFIGQDIPGQRQPTPSQYGHDTLMPERTDQAIESHRGDMADDRAQFQTEAPVCGQESIMGHLRSHRAIAQDEVGQDREHGFAHCTLETPDRDPTQADAHIMGVARQASTSATGRLVCELKAEGQDEGQHTFEKRLAVFHQVEVGGFISKIDGDGAVFSRRFGRCAQVSPLCPQVSSADETRWG
jgi:hypothetical protein